MFGGARFGVPAARGVGPGAFTLVELVVVLGVVFILLGLMLPALGEGISRGRMARDMLLLRQSAMVVDAYTTDYGGVFPLWGEYAYPWIAAAGWTKPLLADGYLDSVRQVDPEINEEETNFRMGMTVAAVFDWKLMRPGHTVPSEEAHWSPVRTAEVFFPSAKGLLFVGNNGLDPSHPDARSYCCTIPWVFPVAMMDASIETGTYLDFNGGEMPRVENNIGVPVKSTWFGVRGLDRR